MVKGLIIMYIIAAVLQMLSVFFESLSLTDKGFGIARENGYTFFIHIVASILCGMFWPIIMIWNSAMCFKKARLLNTSARKNTINKCELVDYEEVKDE